MPKEKSGGFSLFGMGGAKKQDTQTIDYKKLYEAKDSELLELNTRINEMWNQMKSKYPS